ncbi:MAG TPA: adenine phosphoribosyltransferase, partial [Thermoplasmatales archaeon]|nr:adenine phosphoribosyltransferase [Thermoplasmatales archaeon]
LKEGDTIVIVDDVLSTGGTLKAVLKSLRDMNINVKTVVIALDKGRVAEDIEKEMGIPIYSLIHVDVRDEQIIINRK